MERRWRWRSRPTPMGSRSSRSSGTTPPSRSATSASNARGRRLEVDAAVLADAWYVAQSLIAAESIGAVQTCLDVSVEYAKERFTFGRAIGSYQSIKHELVEVLRRLENARGLEYYAGWARGSMPQEFPLGASAARSAAGRALDFAARSMINVHGGIGATWEHDAPLFFRRAELAPAARRDPRRERPGRRGVAGRGRDLGDRAPPRCSRGTRGPEELLYGIGRRRGRADRVVVRRHHCRPGATRGARRSPGAPRSSVGGADSVHQRADGLLVRALARQSNRRNRIGVGGGGVAVRRRVADLAFAHPALSARTAARGAVPGRVRGHVRA